MMRYLQKASEQEFIDACGGESVDVVRERVATYMDQSPVVSRARKTYEHPKLSGPQPVGDASDGEWVWPLVRPELVRIGVFIPETDFVAHVLAGHEPPESLDSELIELAVATALQSNQ